ncbi:interleukin-17F-like [Emydura macquarii macquarii]|uniref:interleukin-17F-like n=1 Tax=Emydura macquarii macquarii TaxID=1129001 RepID=UPI00352B97C9
MAFARHTSLFRTLLLVLILMLSFKRSVHGKAVRTKSNKEGGDDEKKSDGCPTQKNSRFPLSVKIDIHVSSPHHADSMAPDVRNRSLSPWDYSITKDPNRFPEVIAEAKCRHYSCVNSLGQEDYSMNSVPIQQEILVLQREKRGCQHAYRLEKKLVTVGCTCAVPVLHHQS